MSEAHSTYSSQIMDRFGESVTALKKQSKLSTEIAPFILGDSGPSYCYLCRFIYQCSDK